MNELHWPLFGLTVRTGAGPNRTQAPEPPAVVDVELRVPREDELMELASVAARGVHRPGERPFLTPWTEGDAGDRGRSVLQGAWWQRGSWEEQGWALGLGIFQSGRPLGMVTLRAKDFRVVREVTTSSWLGLEHHGRGVGTAARTGLLALAFDHLHAEAALTEVFQDNHASQGVSRRLGYQPDGISRDARGDEALVSDRLRLTRDGWRGRARPPVTVTGLDACRSMFGI